MDNNEKCYDRKMAEEYEEYLRELWYREECEREEYETYLREQKEREEQTMYKELIGIGKEHGCENEIREWISNNIVELKTIHHFSNEDLEYINRIDDGDLYRKTQTIYHIALTKVKDEIFKELFSRGYLQALESNNKIEFRLKLLKP